MITGNKGEWSEIYTLFKLLGDKILQPGDKEIQRLQNIFYPIIKILRTESNGDFEYSIQDDIVVISGDEKILQTPISEFTEKAKILFSYINNVKDRTFSLPEIEEFMAKVKCSTLKASSSSKTDIKLLFMTN